MLTDIQVERILTSTGAHAHIGSLYAKIWMSTEVLPMINKYRELLELNTGLYFDLVIRLRFMALGSYYDDIARYANFDEVTVYIPTHGRQERAQLLELLLTDILVQYQSTPIFNMEFQQLIMEYVTRVFEFEKLHFASPAYPSLARVPSLEQFYRDPEQVLKNQIKMHQLDVSYFKLASRFLQLYASDKHNITQKFGLRGNFNMYLRSLHELSINGVDLQSLGIMSDVLALQDIFNSTTSGESSVRVGIYMKFVYDIFKLLVNVRNYATSNSPIFRISIRMRIIAVMVYIMIKYRFSCIHTDTDSKTIRQHFYNLLASIAYLMKLSCNTQEITRVYGEILHISTQITDFYKTNNSNYIIHPHTHVPYKYKTLKISGSTA
jgi:hypothetical protein